VPGGRGVIGALTRLARHGTLILPAGLMLGLAWQDLAHLMRPLLAPAIFCMLVTILTRVDMAAAMGRVRRPAPLILAVVWAIVVMPPLMALGNAWAGIGGGLAFALVVYTASPPNFAAAGLGYLLGLDGALCLAVILATVIAHPVIAPLAVEFLSHAPVAIPASELALRLLLLVGGALVAAALIRRRLGRERQQALAPAFDGLNVVFMLVFAFALMDGIPDLVAARPRFALMLLGLVYALHIGINLVTALLFAGFGRRTALVLGYAIGGRNIAIVMAALGTAAPADAWLFFALLQFPIYSLPLVLKPIYRRLLGDEVAAGRTNRRAP